MGPSLKLLNLMDKTGLEALILCCARRALRWQCEYPRICLMPPSGGIKLIEAMNILALTNCDIHACARVFFGVRFLLVIPHRLVWK